jgi:hypothetical protein
MVAIAKAILQGLKTDSAPSLMRECLLLVLLFLSHSAGAQKALTPGIGVVGISCAPSNNGSGHMICLEYTSAGSLMGVSWEAPPTPKDNNTETTDTLDSIPISAPGGTLTGVPSCGSANDTSGAVSCLSLTLGSNGIILQGASFYPPNNAASPPALLALGTIPTTANGVGDPSCTSVSNAISTAPKPDGVILCNFTVNGQIYSVAFTGSIGLHTVDPQATPYATGIAPPTSLPPLTGITGNPSCASVNMTAICVVRQGNGLLAFSLLYNPTPIPGSVKYINSVSIPSPVSFTGDPSCAVPADGFNGTSTTLTCAVVSGANLYGVSVTLPGASSETLLLGPAPDGGTWTGGVGCATVQDNRQVNMSLVGCVALSNTANLFEVTFDPRPGGRNLGVRGPFASNLTGVPSCLKLNIDQDRMYCGQINGSGNAIGLNLPVGLLSQSARAAIMSNH